MCPHSIDQSDREFSDGDDFADNEMIYAPTDMPSMDEWSDATMDS